LAIGGDIIGCHLAREIIEAFLNAEFSGDEEFRRRLDKLDVMESE